MLFELMLRNVSFKTISVFNRRMKSSWKVLRLNHVAIVTNNVTNASNAFKRILNVDTTASTPQPEHGVNTVFVDVNNTKLELLDPIGGENSPIWAFLQKNKSGGIHHLCFEVDDLNAAIDDLKTRGIRLLSSSARIGAHGKPVMFIHPKDCNGVLIELEQ